METRNISTRAAAYAVCRRADEILLAHQIVPGPARGQWTLPGGGVEFGEHPRDAVVREVREETGCAVTVGALLDIHSGVFDIRGGERQHVIRLLYAGELSGEPRGTQPDEVDAVQWHPRTGLPTNTTAWAVLGAEKG
jgi:ADP-ribose pyrophosphatase YjhB (NUDIX family)